MTRDIVLITNAYKEPVEMVILSTPVEELPLPLIEETLARHGFDMKILRVQVNQADSSDEAMDLIGKSVDFTWFDCPEGDTNTVNNRDIV
jgi:hypothetical protein